MILAGLITVILFATPDFLTVPRNDYVLKHATVPSQLLQLQRVTIFHVVTIAGKRVVITTNPIPKPRSTVVNTNPTFSSAKPSPFFPLLLIESVLVVPFATTITSFPAMTPHSESHEQSTLGISATSSRPRSGIADFFAPDVFQAVLSDPATAMRLKSFCDSNACSENIDFLEKVCSKGSIDPSKTPTRSTDRAISQPSGPSTRAAIAYPCHLYFYQCDRTHQHHRDHLEESNFRH